MSVWYFPKCRETKDLASLQIRPEPLLNATPKLYLYLEVGNISTSTVMTAKSDGDVMFFLQNYQKVTDRIDSSRVY